MLSDLSSSCCRGLKIMASEIKRGVWGGEWKNSGAMMLYTVKHTSFHPELASSPSEVSSKITRTWPWRTDSCWMWAGTLVAGEQTFVDTCSLEKKAVWNVQKGELQVTWCCFFTFYYRKKKSICQHPVIRQCNPPESHYLWAKCQDLTIIRIERLELKPLPTLLGGSGASCLSRILLPS